jgi:hypothetical protein
MVLLFVATSMRMRSAVVPWLARTAVACISARKLT